MSLFTRLPVSTNDQTLPEVSMADVKWLSGLEENSYEHWIFDSGNSGSLIGKVNGIQLTQQGATPTFNEKTLTLNTLEGNSLLSGITDSQLVGTDGFTMFACFKVPAYAEGSPRPIFGNYSSSSGGFMVDISATPTHYNIQLRGGGITAPASLPIVDFNSWIFVAASGNLVTDKARLFVTSVKQYEENGFSPVILNTGVALGNSDYSNAPSQDIEFAEFGIIKTPYNLSGLSKIYERSKERMAARGIVVA